MKKQEIINCTISDELTMSKRSIIITSILFSIIIYAIIGTLYSMIWDKPFWETFFYYFDNNKLLCLLTFIAFTIVHELLHGLGFIVFAHVPWSEVKFGINYKYFTPYTDCDSILNVIQFRIVSVLPVLILGIIPTIIGMTIGSIYLVGWGLVMICCGLGDFAIIWMTRALNPKILVKSHPTKIGFVIVSN
ncbi:DUF3267 domain-containing protein [Oceanirhabdus sp. W0125-5]|uniref:DUF3267 domain-containing protein n=1 Tax=Oceanirhabdus sp. W0125-5 TaxID=2999116 RepID=UPI0022F2F64C|nr:DUF3267 domain-containing protein [Oceanirhabdus sp. W0125-5]WBW97672.1 DUF3267 domain-containing protein [Oceanirhabdus sp. W0125-5]